MYPPIACIFYWKVSLIFKSVKKKLNIKINKFLNSLSGLLSEKEFCELQDVPFIAPYRIGMGITKGSPFREYVTTSIIKFRTTSILQHNDNQWQLPRMDCSLSQNREVEVDLQHFLPALLLLCSAMIFSFFILFLELVYYYFESNTKLARLCPRIFPEQRLEFINWEYIHILYIGTVPYTINCLHISLSLETFV